MSTSLTQLHVVAISWYWAAVDVWFFNAEKFGTGKWNYLPWISVTKFCPVFEGAACIFSSILMIISLSISSINNIVTQSAGLNDDANDCALEQYNLFIQPCNSKSVLLLYSAWPICDPLTWIASGQGTDLFVARRLTLHAGLQTCKELCVLTSMDVYTCACVLVPCIMYQHTHRHFGVGMLSSEKTRSFSELRITWIHCLVCLPFLPQSEPKQAIIECEWQSSIKASAYFSR